MAKLHLVATGVSLVLASTLSAASADDKALLKQAQEFFKPLPNAVDTPDIPSTGPRVELGHMLFSIPD